MKKSGIILAMLMITIFYFLSISCSKKRSIELPTEPVATNTASRTYTATYTNTIPGSASTATATISATPAAYTFTTDQTGDWDTVEATMPYFTGKTHDTSVGHAANGSLRVNYNFAAGNDAGTIFKTYSSDTDFTGQTVRFWVYVPANLINATNPAGYQIYVKTGTGWVWYSKPWTNITGTAGWQEFVWNLSDGGQLNGSGAIVPVGNINQVRQIGLKIGIGSSTPPASGQLWIDDISVPLGSVSNTSTNTPSVPTNTYTSTATATKTNTATNTPAGATYTYTNTSVPTNTATPTATTGTTSGPPYTFETDTQGFTFDNITDVAITAVSRSTADYHSGNASLACTANFSASPAIQGYVFVDLSASPVDMTNKRMTAWINVPASIVGQGWGIQLVAKYGAAKTWNAQWFNLDAAGWRQFVWDVNRADIRELGIQFSRNGSSVSYTGPLYIDDITVTDIPVVVSARYNFDAGTMGWFNDTVTDTAITAIAHTTVPANVSIGAGALVCTGDFSSATAKGYIGVDLLATPVDLTTGEITVLFYAPAEMVGYGMQIAYKTGPGKTWGAAWRTIDTAGWKKYSCTPGVSNVTEVGIQVLRNGLPTPYTGQFFIDEVNF